MCGFYSITSGREFEETDSSLRYFKRPMLPLDLNIGIEAIKSKPRSYIQEKLSSILTYIVRNKSYFVNNSDLKIGDGGALIPSTKYITYRGVIRKIMCSPYEKRNGWCILATKYKNNIYLCQLTNPEEFDGYPNEMLRKCAHYGPKFEQYCLTDDPFEQPDTSQQIDACTQFFGVFKRKLVGRKFLFAGEMDGIESNIPVNLNTSKREKFKNLKFIELKVSADYSSSKYAFENFKRSKCQNAWTQSFLTGVQDVYFGMRDRWGIVHQIEHYRTEQLLQLGQGYWHPSECFKFLNYFLTLVEDKMRNIDCPNTVFKFNFDEKAVNIKCTEYPLKSELSLLPDWYLEAFKS
ncbi:decapping nuclease DXO homolog isoform X2 [Eupeodes corollae]|nr:decapping nuclease DXO homolog isoform X2 [Eupeodes corollae]XP_055921419.1 decapping nuclease DXO homolog isoform X2 [Eupeodes corollae]